MKLSCRNIDRQVEKLTHRLGPDKVEHFAAGAVQYPAADLFDQVAFFGDGDETTRQNQAALRMLPAHQGFDPDDPMIGEINPRLVMDA